jgi:hypothetical protein
MITWERIAVWADGEYCHLDELDEMLMCKSDDYTVVDIPEEATDDWVDEAIEKVIGWPVSY